MVEGQRENSAASEQRQAAYDVAKDTEQIAGQVFSTGDVYFVPAFSGLYAPYWRKDARGDILEAMNKDCGMPLSKLHVDGNMTSNDLLMQLQADLVGIPFVLYKQLFPVRAQSWDMSALGVAIVAGQSVGVWSIETWRQHATPTDAFLPTSTDDDRDARYTKWKMAVQRSLGWATVKKSIAMTGQTRKSMHNSTDNNSTGSRKNSLFDNGTTDQTIDEFEIDEECSTVEELLKYQARKFSIFVSKTRKLERSILDDAEYFMSKNECDYGMCQCCRSGKKLQTNWESIEEIIENDPEIIFDGDHNPIVVEPKRHSVAAVELAPLDLDSTLLMGSGVSLRKRMHLEKLPAIFKTICNKFTHTSLT
ncbi:hypothetical protein MSG28_015740 [Choristoneura fumiferana]|uniref:Uncharacterized protein n=1 Tax=Choristoneura fumiferana TaxID=7141 RepID=A0ACC0KBT7_CHOFU|nr:hypothetical protein MSG28_015740 [Choristoneura fumiferana]